MGAKLASIPEKELSTVLLKILYDDKEQLYKSGGYSLHDLLMLTELADMLSKRGVQVNTTIIPMPYGITTPDLEDCNYVNEWLTNDELLDIVTCPSCKSNGVVILSRKHNPQLVMEHSTLLFDRFFCLVCHDSWCYEREH